VPARDVVELAPLVVDVSREMSATAVAINEQRFAPNIKTVVSTDDLGSVAESNVGEFLKYMPGLMVDYNAGNAREVSINGVPTGNVPVTVGGFNLASTGVGTARAPSLDFIAINNASRIEVSYSPTPESQGAALAGSVNVVPRSAFNRSRPVFNFSTYLSMRDNAKDFNKTPGPRRNPSRKVHPGVDFSYIRPVNDRFGFTITGGSSSNYSNQYLTEAAWRGTGVATNGGTFPHTTPDQPYLTTYIFQDGSKDVTRDAFGVTLDYRLTRRDRLAFSYQWSQFTSNQMNRIMTFNVGRVAPGNFTTRWTHGSAGAGSLQIANDSGLDRINRTYMPTLTWWHDGPVWRAEAGVGYSFATNRVRGGDKGFFVGSVAQRSGVTVSFDDITYLRPGRITVTDAAGAPVDPYQLGSYSLVSATDRRQNPFDEQTTVYANLRRDFGGRLPFTLKAGLDLRQSIRDITNQPWNYSYVGADGRGSTTPVGSDDTAAPFVDISYSQRTPPYGHPKVQWLSPEGTWEGLVATPGRWVLNELTTYNGGVTNSKRAEEIISAAYLRGDLALCDRRLKLVGGVRAEQTNVTAFGPLNDPTLNYLRDARGQVIRDANGLPRPITSDALAARKLTYVMRGTRVEKEYLRWFPSINASFNLTENFIARAAWYTSIGRPNLNQYSGGLTLPDFESLPGSGNRITVTNVGIKAWTAQTSKVRFEYYFAGLGQATVGAYRREFRDFFGGVVFRPTPEFLEQFGLDAATYGRYDVSTQQNLPGTVRVDGLEFSYKQALTFLPSWARGVQVFANGASLRLTGPNIDRFTSAQIIPRSGSWGISLTRPKFNVRVNWNYRGRQREGRVAESVSIGPGTYNWTGRRYSYDLLGEYTLNRWLSAFATLRNVNDAPLERQIAGPSTPAHAYLDQHAEYGALWTFGIKGTF
jgi:TonB-dependent receptor